MKPRNLSQAPHRITRLIASTSLLLAGISSLQAQTNYYIDYSHNVNLNSIFMDEAGGTFQTDLTAAARLISKQPESIHFELDLDNFSFAFRRSTYLITGMNLSNESHFRYSTSAPRDELYQLLDTATTHSDVVNFILQQSAFTSFSGIESFNSSELSATDAVTNPLHDLVYHDPIRSKYCIQRKYTFTQPIIFFSEFLNILHQEQLNTLLAEVTEVDSEILFPIAIENDLTMTATSNPLLIERVWIQTFWFSSEAAMNHTLTSLETADQNTDPDSHFSDFLTSSGPYNDLTDLTVTETIGRPFGAMILPPGSIRPGSDFHINGQVEVLLSGGANESHLLSWSEDLLSWSDSNINLSVDHGSISQPIAQDLHVIPSTEDAILSLTFPSAIPENAFFRLGRSTLLRP